MLNPNLETGNDGDYELTPRQIYSNYRFGGGSQRRHAHMG